MFLQPFQDSWIVVTCVFLGMFSLGIYPVMLELSVEATYPLDESVVTGLCYLSSAIQGSILMFTENFFNSPLIREEDLSIQTCSASHGEDSTSAGMEAKDFTNYLIYINSYMITLIIIYVIFFNTDYKRTKENANGKFAAVPSCNAEEKEALDKDSDEVSSDIKYVDLDTPTA